MLAKTGKITKVVYRIYFFKDSSSLVTLLAKSTTKQSFYIIYKRQKKLFNCFILIAISKTVEIIYTPYRVVKIVKFISSGITIYKSVDIVYIGDLVLIALNDFFLNLVLVFNFSRILLGSF
jgi:hypothetical protein